MTQTSIAPYPRFRAFYPGTGNPLAGGQLWTLQPGTSGPGFLKATYTDSSGAVQNPNPVILDANGEADVWLSGYTKLVLQDVNGVQVWSVDNVSSMPNTAPTGVTEWITQTGIVLTYLSATQFSTPGDQTALFPAGQRVQASVAAGIIYGTVSNSAASGSPITTTVTVAWDAGALDAGLSAVATGIITSSVHSSLPYNSIGFITGEMRMYGGALAPLGWLLCDGSAVSRNTYQALYNAIGAAFGPGDGSTTFNLPDLRGRLPIGAGQAMPPAWAAGTAYSQNYCVKPTASYNYVYEATTAGTSGTTEPTWPTTIGGTVTDGTITWACRAKWTNRTLGSYGGQEAHTQAAPEVPGMTVSVTLPGDTGYNATSTGGAAGSPQGYIVTGVTGNQDNFYAMEAARTLTGAATPTGAATSAMPVMNPFAAVSFIIKT